MIPQTGKTPQKLQRLKSSTEFRNVLDSDLRIKSKDYLIIVKKNSLGYPRLGLVVSRKTERSSVRRNRIKRILREVFRNNNDLFNSFDTIIIVKKVNDNANYSETKDELQRYLSRHLNNSN